MLQQIKNWIKSNLISLGVIAGLLLFILLRTGCSNVSTETSTIDTALSPVSVYMQAGIPHYKIKTQVITDKKEFKQETKNIAKEIKGRNRILTVVRYVTVSDTVFKYIPLKDSTSKEGDKLLVFGKHDNFVDITATANTTTTTKEGTIEYSSIDTLTFVDNITKHLLKRNERNIDVTNKNPYNKIKYGLSYTLKEPRPLLNASLQLGYNPFTQKLYGGIGIDIPIITIINKR